MSPILFSDLCLLFDAIANASKKTSKSSSSSSSSLRKCQSNSKSLNNHASHDGAHQVRDIETLSQPLILFQKWVQALDSPSTQDGLNIFRLIFPEHDIHRRYGLKESLLAQELPKALGFASSDVISEWNKIKQPTLIFDISASCSNYTANSGCFGISLEALLTQRNHNTSSNIESQTMSLQQISSLLDELASHCEYTSEGIRSAFPHQSRRSRQNILRELFNNMTPHQANYLSQIILRDMSPLLYPIASSSLDAQLQSDLPSHTPSLDLNAALDSWHWALPRIFKFRADLDAAFLTLEENPFVRESCRTSRHGALALAVIAKPNVGCRVEIPSTVKGRSCSKVADIIRDVGVAYAETKYDGERMQIHVNMDSDSKIKIFSKSKRDSTIDRQLTHPIIMAALGFKGESSLTQPSALLLERLGNCQSRAPHTVHSTILEAEMVAYDEHADHIADFSDIPACLQPAIEVEGPARLLDSSQTHTDAKSNAHPRFHLALVFFDVLCLNNESLVRRDYDYRRQILTDTIIQIPGFSMVASRVKLDFRSSDQAASRSLLIHTFARSVVNRDEGLIIKIADSLYNDHRLSRRWIKLKRGLGDTMSCCIVGAAWSKERARLLRVPVTCYTEFFVGVLDNEDEIFNASCVQPRYRVLFTVSYLPDRLTLLRANALIHMRGGIDKASWTSRIKANWEFDLIFEKHIENRPCFILASPLIFELFGAGFTRSRGSKHHELRFPRVSAIHYNRPSTDAIAMNEFQRAARRSLSYAESEAESEVDSLWSKHSSAGTDSSGGASDDWREKEVKHWVRRLVRSDVRQKVFTKRKLTETRTSAGAQVHTTAKNTRKVLSLDKQQPEAFGDPEEPSLPKPLSFKKAPSNRRKKNSHWSTFPAGLTLPPAFPVESRINSWQTLLALQHNSMIHIDCAVLFHRGDLPDHVLSFAAEQSVVVSKAPLNHSRLSLLSYDLGRHSDTRAVVNMRGFDDLHLQKLVSIREIQ